MIPQISVQLYSVREQAEADYEGTIRAIAEMGFENVETAGFPGSSPEQAARLFKDLGIKAPSCHSPLPVGDNRNAILDTALLLGSQYIITGGPPQGKQSIAAADAIRANAELYCEAADFMATHGIQIGYHNHDWDLAEVDGQPAYRLFLANTPDTVLWEADIFWIAKAGIDPVDFIREIGPRGKLLHFKDGILEAGTPPPPYRPAGAGEVDLKAAAAAATQAEYIVVELDAYAGDMMQAVKQSYDYLTANKIASGRK